MQPVLGDASNLQEQQQHEIDPTGIGRAAKRQRLEALDPAAASFATIVSPFACRCCMSYNRHRYTHKQHPSDTLLLAAGRSCRHSGPVDSRQRRCRHAPHHHQRSSTISGRPTQGQAAVERRPGDQERCPGHLCVQHGRGRGGR